MTVQQTIAQDRLTRFLNDLLMELVTCWQQPHVESDQVEAAFLVTKKYCETLKHRVWADGFSDESEEIYFFKNAQPEFTGRLMYYSIIYEALLSVPQNIADATEFWQQERLRFSRFIRKHVDFVQYMDGEESYFDEHYFLRRNKGPLLSAAAKIYECCEDHTSHNALAAQLFAEHKYYEYTRWKLIRLQENQ